MAIKLFLKIGSVKAVIVTGFTHSLCQARIKGSSSKLLNFDGSHILTLSRVHFVRMPNAQAIMVNCPSNLDLILHPKRYK